MPKDRYRLYHLEKARGGVGLTMIGGSAVVSPDSPPAFGNMLLYRDEIVPWLARLTDDVHEAGAAVMCQVTHLGRRTSNFTGDWLPLVYPSGLREAQHRSFPKVAEAWDVDRIVGHFADAAARCQAAGLDGIEIQSYGHLFDAWASPVTNDRDDAFGGDRGAAPGVPAARAAGGAGRGGPRLRRRPADVDGRGPARRARGGADPGGAASLPGGRHRLPLGDQGRHRHRRPARRHDPVDGHPVGAAPGVRRRDPPGRLASR